MIHADEGLLQAHLDGEMPEMDRIALESHLAVCAKCRAQQDELRQASRLLHSALVTSDVVAGTMTALEGFAARRHALGGAPAAANGAAPHAAARQRPSRPQTQPLTTAKRTTFVRRLRVARGGLLKAAALALLLAGAASAAIPEGPVRRLIDAVRDRFVEDPAPVPAAQASDATAPGPSAPAPQERIEPAYLPEPADGALRVRLRSVGENALIHIRLVDEAKATIRPMVESGVESYTGRGWIELRNLGDGDVFVDLPRSADRLTVEVDGRTYFQKLGQEMRSPGPVVTSKSNEYVFRAHP